jgi:hypothetical protein
VTPVAGPAPAPRRPAGRSAVPLGAWLLLGLVVVAAGLIRVRLRNVPFERDEGEYAYEGQLILSGAAPYWLLNTQKLPGTHLVYAVSMAVFGQTIAGARAFLLLATGGTCVGIFLLARRLFAAPAALAGAAAYAVLSLSTELLGPFGHATHFVAFFGVWGLVALLRALDREGVARCLVPGFLLGLAILMKQHGVVFLVCAAVWIAVGPSRTKARKLGALLLAAAIPGAVLGIWLLLSGTFGRFWFWVVRYGASYGTLEGLPEGWRNLVSTTSRFLPQAALLWLLAACGALLLLTRRFSSEIRWRLATFAVLSFLGVCPGLYFREHYFLLFLPAAALLVAAACEAAGAIPSAGRALVPALIVLACAQALWSQREVFFQAAPDEVSRLVYGPDLFPESVEIGRYLRGHTRPGDELVVFGSEPQILFYAGRRSATGFVFMYPLMEAHRFAHEMQEAMIREVEARRPAYCVLVKTPTSWLERPDSDQTMQDWAVRYLNEHYALAGQVVVSDRGTRYLWDAAAAGLPILDASQALVMRRRDFVPGR